MMLQGNLQNVFDALYTLGVIEPVLKMDWAKEFDRFQAEHVDVNKAIDIANFCNRDVKKMVVKLQELEPKTLNFLAMEVAREYANFYSRETVH